MLEWQRLAVQPCGKQHERVARHYQTASINLALEVTQRINAGEFTWKRDFKNLHPSPFGHKLYLNSIKRLFDYAWRKPLSLSRAVRASSREAGVEGTLRIASFGRA